MQRAALSVRGVCTQREQFTESVSCTSSQNIAEPNRQHTCSRNRAPSLPCHHSWQQYLSCFCLYLLVSRCSLLVMCAICKTCAVSAHAFEPVGLAYAPRHHAICVSILTLRLATSGTRKPHHLSSQELHFVPLRRKISIVGESRKDLPSR